MDGSTDVPMVLRRDDSSGPLRVNGSFTEQVGFSELELAERPLLDWIHPDDRPALEQQLSAGEGRASARHRTQRDEWLIFDWQVRTDAGAVVVLGLLRREDVGTEHPLAERVASSQPTMTETLDAMARIVEAKNPGMRCSILLTDPEREHIVGGAGPSLPDAYNKAVEGLRIGPGVGSCGTATFWNEPVVVENIAVDPLWKDLRDAAAIAGVSACWSHPMTTTGGEVLGAMALYYDEPRAPTRNEMEGLETAARMVALAIERDRLEEQLRRTMKAEAIGVLAGGIAHDFNNLMAVVLGNAELAMTTLDESSAAKEMLQEIVTASVNAADLCKQLLAYAGRGALTPEPIECNTLVRELGSLMQVAVPKAVELRTELHDGAVAVMADGSQLRQVIMNLITNAAQALRDDEGSIVIGTSLVTCSREQPEPACANSDLEPGEYVRLWVRDTGAGMSAKTQARMFDPFFTTKPAGRGLGLAAVQGIVRSHGGGISVDSTPGAGTTIAVLLPRSPEPVADTSPAPRPTTEASGARILVVDDEPSVCIVVSEMLEGAGHAVTRAGDGQSAVEIFRREADSIDCVLLDLSMPKMGGDEVFAEMQEIRADVPVILTSGFAEQDVLERFQGTGLAGVIQKPARRHVLLAKIADALNRTEP